MAFDPLEFHADAVQTPSHESVEAMRDLLVETLERANVDPRVDDAGNAIATRTAAAEGPHLVLNTHIDTVPPHVDYQERATIPGGDGTRLDPVDGRPAIVAGRGACDAKGPLAALVDAFLAADVPAGRLTLAVTPDEEVYSTGAHALALDADAYVVGEPTDLDACPAARGRFEGTIEVAGEAAHAAEPDSGANAIRGAAAVVEALADFDSTRGPGAHDTLGVPTLEPTMVEGGAAANQLPASCRVTFDRRSVPPETSEGFRDALSAHCDAALPAEMESTVRFADRETPFLEAFATDHDDHVVQTLAEAAGARVRPFGAATEASYFAAAAPTVVFGPGVLADEYGAVAHAEREYVHRQAILAAAEALRSAIPRVLAEAA